MFCIWIKLSRITLCTTSLLLLLLSMCKVLFLFYSHRGQHFNSSQCSKKLWDGGVRWEGDNGQCYPLHCPYHAHPNVQPGGRRGHGRPKLRRGHHSGWSCSDTTLQYTTYILGLELWVCWMRFFFFTTTFLTFLRYYCTKYCHESYWVGIFSQAAMLWDLKDNSDSWLNLNICPW